MHRRLVATDVATTTTQVVAVEKPQDVTSEAFRTYCREAHAPLVTALPNLARHGVPFPQAPGRSLSPG
jgi:hypothetical protein